jgi:hypothetical protein
VDSQSNAWQTVKAREAEVDALQDSGDEARQARSLDSLPLVVVSRDPEKGAAPGLIPSDLSRRFENQWVLLQEELTHLSTNGSRVVANWKHPLRTAGPSGPGDCCNSESLRSSQAEVQIADRHPYKSRLVGFSSE